MNNSESRKCDCWWWDDGECLTDRLLLLLFPPLALAEDVDPPGAGVWNSPYIRRMSALFSSINFSIGSLYKERKKERKNSFEETHRAVSSSALLHDALERPLQQQQQQQHRQKVKVLILNEYIIPPPRTVAQQTLTHLISHFQTKTALARWFNKEIMNNVPWIAIASRGTEELIKPLDAGQATDDVAAQFQSHGHRHGRPKDLSL